MDNGCTHINGNSHGHANGFSEPLSDRMKKASDQAIKNYERNRALFITACVCVILATMIVCGVMYIKK